MTMKNSTTWLQAAYRHGGMMAAALLLTACGVGGVHVALSGGIGGSGFSRGPVTSYGSIVVNGVHFDINGASFERDGVPSASKPGIGEVVTVEGSFNQDGVTGTAKTVAYRPLIIGPVTQAPDMTAQTVMILGQTVHVDARTVYEGFTGLAELQPGVMVEVSGLFQANGQIRATLLRKRTATAELHLQGSVTNLDPVAHRFTLGGETVDYYRASAPSLANGAFVEVRGTAGTAVNELDATKVVVPERGFACPSGQECEVEVSGYVDSVSGNHFIIDGTRFTVVTGETRFENGTLQDLTSGARVEVEAQADAAGALVAHSIEFSHEGAIKIKAPADSVTCNDAACRSATVTVLGIPLHIGLETVVDGDQDHDGDGNDEGLDLSKTRAGDWFEISAYQHPQRVGGVVTAIQIGRADASPTVKLTGHVQTFSQAQQQLKILGVTIDTSTASFDDGAANFYGSLKQGDVVEVTGTAGPGTSGKEVIHATEVSTGEED